jgi:hypothetical protein
MTFFNSFKKQEIQRGEQVLPRAGAGGRGWNQCKEGGGRVNIVQILCAHVCKWKNETC